MRKGIRELMKNPILTLLRLVVLFSTVLSVNSQCLSQDIGLGVILGSQIQIFSDPEGASLGNSGVAYKNAVWASLSNPAGLAGLGKWQISFSRIPSTSRSRALSQGDFFNQNAVALGLTLPKEFAAGMSVIFLDLGGPQFFDPKNGKIIKRSSDIQQWQGTLARRFHWLFLGVNVKYVDRDLGPTSSSAWMFDFGAQMRVELGSILNRAGWVSMGVSISNLSSGFEFESQAAAPRAETVTEPTLKLLRLGLAGGARALSAKQRRVLSQFMGTLEYQRVVSDYGAWDHLVGGLELEFLHHLSGRMGYNLDLRDEKLSDGSSFYQGLTYGIGLKTHGNLQFEIAYGRGVRIGNLNVHTFAGTLKYTR